MTHLVFAMGRLLDLHTWKKQLFRSVCDLEIVSYAMRCVLKQFAEAPHWQVIETYKNTTMQQNNIWSTAFEAHTKEI